MEAEAVAGGDSAASDGAAAKDAVHAHAFEVEPTADGATKQSDDEGTSVDGSSGGDQGLIAEPSFDRCVVWADGEEVEAVDVGLVYGVNGGGIAHEDAAVYADGLSNEPLC